MAQGAWAGTNSSAEIVARDINRVSLTIQLLVRSGSTVITSLGFGTAAVSGEGYTLVNVESSITVRGALAKKAVYAITSSGTSSGGYQTVTTP